MKDSTILCIVAIVCITILEVVNAFTMKIDGNVISLIIGSIVFVATKKYYEARYFGKKKK